MFESLCSRQTYVVHHSIMNLMTRFVNVGVRCWIYKHLVVVYVPIMMNMPNCCDCGMICALSLYVQGTYAFSLKLCN